MVRVRFAPSPTGIPHIGNTRTALFNFLFARHNQGKLILRIEDTDQARLVPGSLEKILEILKIVGITWDEGPYIQSERLKIYKEHALALVKKGAAYYCDCPKGEKNCHCRHSNLPKVKPYVVRLKVPAEGKTGWQDLIQGRIEFNNSEINDQVLLKSDGYPTYHLAVVVDDHLMKISHILRGVEWISSTPKHLLLYQAFGWPIPQIGHFPVILGPDKAKLSKRHGAKSVLEYQAEGYLPQALVSFMAYLGWSYRDNSQVLTLKELTQLFDIKHIQKGNAIFDLKKLNYFNAKLIRTLPEKQLLQLIKPFPQYTKIVPLIRDRLVKLSDIDDQVDYFIKQPEINSAAVLEESKMSPKDTKIYLEKVKQTLQLIKVWSQANLEKSLHELQINLKLGPRPAFMTIRLAICGRPATPPLFSVLEVIGKETVIKRLIYAQTALS